MLGRLAFIERCTQSFSLIYIVTDKTYDLAEDGYFVEDEIFHVVVFGVQNVFAVALVETLDRRAVLDEGDDYFAVFGGVLLPDDELVAVENADLNHGVALDGEHEHVVRAEHVGGNGEVVLVIFLCENGFARGDGADEGNFDAILLNVDCAALVFADLAFGYHTFVCQFVEVGEGGGGGRNVARRAYLANAGGVTVLRNKLQKVFVNALGLIDSVSHKKNLPRYDASVVSI